MPVTTRSSVSNHDSKPRATNLDPPPEKSLKKTSKMPSSSPKTTPPPEDPTSPIFFWKFDETPYGPFCQWYPSSFTQTLLTFTIHTHPTQLPYLTGPTHPLSPQTPTPPITFTSCEQFMMAHKAHLFSPDNTEIYKLILSSSSPGKQKALGRCVPNFDESIWEAHRFDIVKWGNYSKFTQNEELKELLLGTGERELVEVDPKDRVWGVGFDAKDAEKNRERWGLNLLGKALMEVRKRIRSEEEEKVKGKKEEGDYGDKAEGEGEGNVTTRSSASSHASKPRATNLDPPPEKSLKKNTKKPSSSPKTTSHPTEDPTSPIFFWDVDEIPYGPFCQWYPSPFTQPLLTFTIHTHPTQLPYLTGPTHSLSPQTPTPPITFTSSEQFMMAHKAHLFSPDDTEIYDLILSSSSPREQKALGRRIPNFDESIWEAHRFDIVKWGNYFKFTQDEELKELLLGTGERELVEASPRDRIWGVGFGAKNAEKNRERWGLNLLGKVLMEVRKRIRKEEEEKAKGKKEEGDYGDKAEGEGEGKGERA